MLGPACFAALAIVLSLACEIGLEVLGLRPTLASPLGLNLFAIPLALAIASRIGSLRRVPVLVASVAVAAVALLALVFMITQVVAPGAPFQLADLFAGSEGVRNLSVAAATLVTPQLWLSAGRRLSANNSSKPTPLRGAA